MKRGEIRSPLLLSVRQAAQLLGICENTAYAMAARGELPSMRVGRRVLIPRRRLDDWITNNSAETASDSPVSAR